MSTTPPLGHPEAGPVIPEVAVSRAPEDPSWDEFLAHVPGGHHVQTSMWGRVKASLGWGAARIVLRHGSVIAGGCQMLYRRFPGFGVMGYIPKGPIMAPDQPHLIEYLLPEIHRFSALEGVRYLMVQPPNGAHRLTSDLETLGFGASPMQPFPKATTMVDLTDDEDKILARMESKTRYNIRKGLKKGLVVRDGHDDDLALSHSMMMETAKRQGFREYQEDYFRGMRNAFAPTGNFKLFVAEYQGRPLSTLLVIPFGDTVLFKKAGWSGLGGEYRPNQVMHWTAMQWAKNEGYRTYDLEGIDEGVAEALLADNPIARDKIDSVTRFKIGFGGHTTLHPHTMGFTSNKALRWCNDRVFPRLSQWPMFKRFLAHLKFN